MVAAKSATEAGGFAGAVIEVQRHPQRHGSRAQSDARRTKPPRHSLDRRRQAVPTPARTDRCRNPGELWTLEGKPTERRDAQRDRTAAVTEQDQGSQRRSGASTRETLALAAQEQ